MPDMVWTEDAPQGEGFYWFYGKRFPGDVVGLYAIEAYNSSNGLVYSCRGAFMFAHEFEGKFLPIIQPKLPEN